MKRKKLKWSLVWMQAIFLLFMIGGGILIYFVVDTPYLEYVRSKSLYEIYDCISDIDLTSLTEENLGQLEKLQKKNVLLEIADETFAPVFVTKKSNQEGYSKTHIQSRLDQFSEEPMVYDDSTQVRRFYLTAIVRQEERMFYVYVREAFGRVYPRSKFTEIFLITLVVISILTGSLVMWYLGRKIVKPLEQMAIVSEQMIQCDFSQKVCEESRIEETYVLAKNFNSMARELENYIDMLENKNQKLLTDNEILQQNQEQNKKLEQMRQEFFANISHELKTPLAVISSQVEMIEFLQDSQDKEYYFASVHDEIEKMAAMVKNLLQISAAEHELEGLKFQKIDFSELVCGILKRYHPIFCKKGIHIQTDIDMDCYVQAEMSSIEQAIGNYLSNAVSHTKKGQMIQITLKKENGNVYLNVYNDGKQIQEKNMEHIWNDYYQEEKGESSEHIGIGLYIVKKTILLHHGLVGVYNEPEGVCFWLMIPEAVKNTKK